MSLTPLQQECIKLGRRFRLGHSVESLQRLAPLLEQVMAALPPRTVDRSEPLHRGHAGLSGTAGLVRSGRLAGVRIHRTTGYLARP